MSLFTFQSYCRTFIYAGSDPFFGVFEAGFNEQNIITHIYI